MPIRGRLAGEYIDVAIEIDTIHQQREELLRRTGRSMVRLRARSSWLEEPSVLLELRQENRQTKVLENTLWM